MVLEDWSFYYLYEFATSYNISRNKEEGYFIASELLKKILSCCKGIESVRRSAALLKRLRGLVEELNRKVYNEKRLDLLRKKKQKKLP